jgi:N-acetylmuramoyl-L-alanine amidase
LQNRTSNFQLPALKLFGDDLFGIILLLFAGIVLSSCATMPSIPEGPATNVIFTPVGVAPGPRADMVHVIGPGETAYRISKMYDVPLKTILEANHILDPKDLRVGQRLDIPGAAPLRPVIPIFKSYKWDYIVIHHSVTDSGDAMSLDVIHRHRGFERGLGYHFVVDNGTTTRVDGQIEASPRWIKQMDGAHCNAGGMNKCGIGICLVGDFTYQEPSQAQMDSLVLLVDTLRRYYNIPINHVIRHKDVPGKRTACPGNSFPWEEFKRCLRAGR